MATAKPGPDTRTARPSCVLAIDPGTRIVGFAVVASGIEPAALDHGALRLRVATPIAARLADMHRAIQALIARWKPTAVVLEAVFYGKNFRSALRIGESRGVALVAAAEAGLSVVEYTPAVVKKSVTGNGQAQKTQVQRMVTRLFGLAEPPEPLDASDALALAYCHLRRSTRAALLAGAGAETPLQRALRSLKKASSKRGDAGSSRLKRLVEAAKARERLRSDKSSTLAKPAKGGKDLVRMGSASTSVSAGAKAASGTVVSKTEIPGARLLDRGKVRDLYDAGEQLLIVTSDRISAFDVVLPDGIPDKGKVLTRLSVFWFGLLQTPHHLITADVSKMPAPFSQHASLLQDRSMLVRRLKIVPIECVVRGYLAGAGWSEYKKVQSVCGVKLPPGLKESDRLPLPIFTPTTKEEAGHDQPLTFEEMAAKIGAARAAELRDRSIEVYRRAAEHALTRGIIICDTKFEWGIPIGGAADDPKAAPAVLADEVLTPDSSRFWPLDGYQPGRSQPSFDKQGVRDWLTAQPWDKKPPAPHLPPEVIAETTKRYREIYERLTGKSWS